MGAANLWMANAPNVLQDGISHNQDIASKSVIYAGNGTLLLVFVLDVILVIILKVGNVIPIILMINPLLIYIVLSGVAKHA